jgi:hypothetical protein
MRVERDPCADCHGPPTETDWLAIFLALAAVVYSGAHYIGYDFEYLQHYFHFARSPRVRTTVAVLQRIGFDLIRFALAILGITLILVLQCKKALSYVANSFWHASSVGTLAGGTFVGEKIGLHYDAINHSHHANLARQRFRAARARFGTFLRWGIPVAAVVLLFHGPPEFADSSPVSKPEVISYKILSWVILARPENRYHEHSNCHYRPGDECLALEKNHNAKTQSLELQSKGLQSLNIVSEQLDVTECTLSAINKSEDTTMTDNDNNTATTEGTTPGSYRIEFHSLEAGIDGQSTVTIALIRPASHTQI